MSRTRTRGRGVLVALLALVAGVGPASAQERTHVFTGATIHTMAGEVIESGAIVVRDGIIQAVGAEVPVPLSADVVTHDVSVNVWSQVKPPALPLNLSSSSSSMSVYPA